MTIFMPGSARGAEHAALAAAVEAARQADARAFFAQIAGSFVLDGIAHRLRTKWKGADDESVHHAIAESTDSLFERLRRGGHVLSPGGYLWGAADKVMTNLARAKKRISPTDPTNLDQWTRQPDSRRDPGALRSQAIRLARSLLPRLTGNNFRVMEIVVECVEQGELYVDNATIGDALGMTAEAVSVCKSRGFARLRAEARREGIRIEDYFEDEDK